LDGGDGMQITNNPSHMFTWIGLQSLQILPSFPLSQTHYWVLIVDHVGKTSSPKKTIIIGTQKKSVLRNASDGLKIG
jgi:hypothetical protein